MKIARSQSKESALNLRKAVDALEGRVDAMSTALFETPSFAKTANMANTFQRRVKKGVANRMGKRLAFYNMPSREDVTALGERIISVEDRLVRIEAMLLKLIPAEAVQPAPGPRRTKRPPGAKAAARATRTKTVAPASPAPAPKTKAAAAKTTTKRTTTRKKPAAKKPAARRTKT